jgi:hypothetical protein
MDIRDGPLRGIVLFILGDELCYPTSSKYAK